MAENKKQISEYFSGLPENSSPSSATYLVVEENGVTKKIPISVLVQKNADGTVTLGDDITTEGSLTVKGVSNFDDSIDVKYGNIIRFWSDDNTKYTDIYCDDDGNLIGKGDSPIATEEYVDETVASIAGNSNTPTYSEGLRYLLTTDKTGYDVVGIGTCTDTDIIVPPIYEGLPVKKIGFQNVTTITSLTLPNTIVSMGHYVFKGCSNLRKMNIPDSVTTIGQDIFNECPNVTVYCEAKSKPEGWHSTWDRSARHVVWGAFDFISTHERIDECITEAELDEKLSSLPSGGSGDSSIIDLGEIGDHKEAQGIMVGHLEDEENGCYLFKYWCGCSQTACFATVYKENAFTEGVVLDSGYRARRFSYDSKSQDYGFDGCWEDISGSGEATLSMPRIRLANHWMASDGIACNKESKEWFGEYVFSVEIMDGTLQEGDQLQICNLTNHKNSRGVRVRKPRRFAERVITTEDIEMLSYNPYLQISVADNNLREIYRSCSSDGVSYKYPKYIRIRRPIYSVDSEQEISAIFSNVVCADVRIPISFITEENYEEYNE